MPDETNNKISDPSLKAFSRRRVTRTRPEPLRSVIVETHVKGCALAVFGPNSPPFFQDVDEEFELALLLAYLKTMMLTVHPIRLPNAHAYVVAVTPHQLRILGSLDCVYLIHPNPTQPHQRFA